MTKSQVRRPEPEAEFGLDDRYRSVQGAVYLSGLQALVRLPLDQRRRDLDAGLTTAGFISGYEGSPLAGYDLELARQQALLDEYGIVFRPGLNEELAVDAVQGSQLASLRPDRRVDGVTGYWYGKAPGLDRAGDAFRHANLGGTAPTGGAVAFVGDDATAKSSTVPSSSEPALAELGMPILVPADPQDVLDLGLHAVALSRFTGLWAAMKIATSVADGSGSARVEPDRLTITLPDNEIAGRAFVHTPSASYLQPYLTALEQSLFGERLELARRYAAANQLNRLDAGGAADRIGIVAAGSTFLEVRQALDRLGLSPEETRGRGIRLLKLGMVHPLEPTIVRRFADGLTEIIVVEDKRSFIETAIKDLLYGRPGAPAVHGRVGPDGRVMFPATGELTAVQIAAVLTGRLLAQPGFEDLRAPVVRPPTSPRTSLPLASRTPFFCSGCPHNRSTAVPAGSLVGAGIGCSALAVLLPTTQVGTVIGLTQMGGEGAAWIGMQPFVETPHLFQNLGDGTFHHSGSLAIRAAVAAGSPITFKLLYNSTVAMTGGQAAVGVRGIPDLTRLLAAEGVRRIVITTEDPSRYRRIALAPGVTVTHRDNLLPVQQELAQVPGVTVLIHDQECATELRRKRKRGRAPVPAQRAFINERVCEGCGDCGRKSNCLSVRPVETEYGRKTRIHQDSCNLDLSCLDGDCPSFLSVRGGGAVRPERVGSADLTAAELPEPVFDPGRTAGRLTMRITGIGGTGVVTAAQIVATAAAISGHHVRALDQTGLAQKGGAVVSDIKFSTEPVELSNRITDGECDLYLGCDLLVAAAPANLAVADPSRTVAVVSTSEIPTGAMVIDTTARFPDAAQTIAPIAERSRPGISRFVDAQRASTELFGDGQASNVFLLGVAYQLGVLPLPARTIEQAIELNAVAVPTNLQAFRRGRQLIADPDRFTAAVTPIAASPDRTEPAAETGTELPRRRGAELVAYQDERYAATYAAFLAQVAELEQTRLPGSSQVTDLVAHHLFNLMAYKDEYEVARLSVHPELVADVRRQFGPDASYGFRLHPPVLRALGLKHKITIDSRFGFVLGALYRARRLRGTIFDPFGHTALRRVERGLIAEYRELVLDALGQLSSDNIEVVTTIAAAPDLIRGYEDVKLASISRYREVLDAAAAELAASPPVARRSA